MKKIIKWLADVSGVTKDIEKETTKFIGNQMLKNSLYYSEYSIFRVCIKAYSEKLIEGKKKTTKKDVLECRDRTFNHYKQLEEL